MPPTSAGGCTASKGGLAAGLLFVLPGALVVLALSMIYAAFGKLPLVEALFVGVKAAVLAIVVEALLRIGQARAQRAPSIGRSQRSPSSASSSWRCRFR